MLLSYDIGVVGADNVSRALASIERRMGVHQARVNRMLGSGQRGTSGASPRVRDPMSRGFAEIAKAAQLQQRADIRAAQNVARERERLEKQAFRRKVAMQNRHFAEEQRAAERLERAQSQARAANARGRAQFVQSTIGNTSGRIGRAVGAVGSTGAALVGLGGAALGVAAVSQASRLDEQARRLAIAGRGMGEAGANPDALRKRFTQIGIATGIAPEAVASGVSAFTAETGDLDAGMRNAKTFATTAQAFDADVTDIARIGANLKKLGIDTAEGMQEAFAKLGAQSKKAGFEIKNMASELPEVFSSMASFGFKGQSDLSTIGGLMQIAQKATGNASESTTAVQNAMRQIIARSADLQSGKVFSGRKVKVFEGGDPTKPLRGIRDIFGDMIEASRGNIVQLNELLDIRGSKAFSLQTAAFRSTRESALKGGASQKEASRAGREAAMRILEDAADVQSSFAEVERDATDAMKSFSVQMTIFNSQIKDAVATELFPELVKLAPALKELVPVVRDAARAFVDISQWLAKNPLTGIGAAIAASILLDIGKAKIGAVIAAAVARMVAGAPVAVPGGVPVGGVPGAPIAAGRFASVGGKLLGGAAGGAAGFALGSTVGAALGGGSGQETGARVGTAAGIGAGVAGPLGALIGTSVGMLFDSIDKLHTQLQTFDFGDQPGKTRGSDEALRLQEESLRKAAEESARILKEGAKAAAEEMKKSASGSTLNRGNSPTNPKLTPG